MSLKRARQVARAAAKQGLKVHIASDAAACELHSPGRHSMSGNTVVVETYWDGAGEAARYLWT